MPVVPSLDPSAEVTPSQAPSPQATSVATPGLLNQGAAQIGQLGDALGGAANAASSVAIDMANRFNETRVDDAFNATQAKAYTLKYDPQTGYVNKTGADAVTPNADGLLPADAAVANLKDFASQTRMGLTPEQQRLYDLRFNAYSTQFGGEALQHEGQQTRAYSLQTNDATSKLAQDAAAQDFGSPSLLSQHVNSAGSAAYKNAQVQGLQGPALVATVKGAQSQVIMAGFNAAVASNDFASASAIQKQYGGFLTADDAVRADAATKTINNNLLGTTAAGHATAGLLSSTTPAGATFGANIAVESGGKQLNADGTPVTSSKGAIGIAQVKPDTGQETALKHGVPWDPVKFRTDAQYNASLGQMYWSDQLAANNGDVAKADAAYNGGPGTLQAAMQKANAAGTPGAWLSYMLPETQAYVPKVAAARQTGIAYQPTKEDVLNRINADPSLAANPAAKKIALDLADKQVTDHLEAIAQHRTQALASAQTLLFQNQGDMSRVPPDTLNAIDPKELPGLQKYAADMRQGGTSTDPALYADVQSNMPKYAAMPDAQWLAQAQPNLSRRDFEVLSKQRGEFKSGQSSQAPSSLDMPTITRAVDMNAVQMGLDPHISASKDMDAAGRIGALYQGANDYVASKQRTLGRKLNPVETQAAVGEFFRTPVLAGDNGWFSSQKTQQLGTVSVSDIPSDEKTRIKADLVANQNIPNPTDAQVLNAYVHLHTKYGKPATAPAAPAARGASPLAEQMRASGQGVM